ncbi:hypothetical protein MHJ85_08555 [Brevibacterium ravenspurgense]|uniref:hypothetical protein n=1 Tax=Brevibacterium TaxID=1696 RepID=UPI00114D27F1|nr:MULTISPECIES: hypothetical protein [Brevibacterium]MCG7301304.1 hypothetical protein [Brevibacterium ravenspurgense]
MTRSLGTLTPNGTVGRDICGVAAETAIVKPKHASIMTIIQISTDPPPARSGIRPVDVRFSADHAG